MRLDGLLIKPYLFIPYVHLLDKLLDFCIIIALSHPTYVALGYLFLPCVQTSITAGRLPIFRLTGFSLVEISPLSAPPPPFPPFPPLHRPSRPSIALPTRPDSS